ncbi:MAG TPA: maleylpyruvate isomerase family mycothiol-dependent enzyme, partial [Actinomycetota bacterium]|nr:maleylpyruvate isomerase family mycothiol-dependent enzyme [Actinomycetota bacterium]
AIFSAADPEAPAWVWGSDKHTRFWSRRMVFETAIHRVDAEIALGVEPAVDPALSIDGIDEFLDNLPFASYFAPRVDLLRGTGERLRFVATDAGVEWTLTFSPEALEWDHSNDGDAHATVSGTASDLLLYVYGRSDRVAQSGDEAVLTLWRENSAI